MKVLEPTLKERAGQLYRRLLLLQGLFQPASADDDPDWTESGDRGRNIALCAAVREVLDELAEHARILTLIPLPLNEWRPEDGPNDERWRALTELERREILSLTSGYENLIGWGEAMVRGALTGQVVQDSQGRNGPQEMGEATEYLKAERARLDRFRGEMGFLDRRRGLRGTAGAKVSIDENDIQTNPEAPFEQQKSRPQQFRTLANGYLGRWTSEATDTTSSGSRTKV